MGSAMSRSQNSTKSRKLRRVRRPKVEASLKLRTRQLWRLVKKIRLLGLRRALLERRRARVAAAATSEEEEIRSSRCSCSCSAANLSSSSSSREDLGLVQDENDQGEIQPGELESALIPGLPHDVGIQCLARVPRAEHRLLRAVCRGWRRVVAAPEFGEQRRRLGCAEDWLYLHVGTSPHLDEIRQERDSSHPNSSSSISSWKLRNSSSSRSGNKWQLVGGFSLWHALDPYSYEWRALPPVPYDPGLTGGQVVLGATSLVLDGKLFVIGGAPFGKAAIRDVWVYSPLRNRWTAAAPMKTPRFACLAAAIDGQLYVIGGSGICHLTGYSLPCLEVYSPASNSWSFRASARGIVTAHPCSPLKFAAVVGGKLCVSGPHNPSGATNAGVYDPDSDTWSPMMPGLRSGWGKPSAVMDGRLYTLHLGCYQQYVPDADAWLPVKGSNNSGSGNSEASSLLEWDPRLVSAMAGGSNGKLYMVGTMGPALIVVIAPVREPGTSAGGGGSGKNNSVCWHTMKLPNGVDFLGDLGHCSCQVISF